jgi:ZIP family zinc transporter
MRSDILALGSVRLLRLALGLILVIVGTALLVAQGLSWVALEPRMLRALEGGAICALGTALGAVPVLVIRGMPVTGRGS